ncbi:MAG: ATP-binding cassette domain-containing protein [Azoarcus sp.]|nr:ATP-binding cassette domain-containing protein [Azoarcus sp.]
MKAIDDPACAVGAKGLVVRDLKHGFALRTVLEDIGFEVAPGRVTALVGPSGCGKTTLLHLCAGLSRPREGRIDNRFERPAYVFQQPRLLPWKSALDNIALGLKALGAGRAEREARAHALAVAMGLAADDMDKYPHQLSGGMQSRVALARALVLEPDLLLLDEPFAALDIGLKHELHALLLAYLGRVPAGVLMVTHDLMEAVRLSHTILVMAPEPGRIVRRFELDLPPAERDDAFVYEGTAGLLQDAAVRAGFGLGQAAAPAASVASVAHPPSGHCDGVRQAGIRAVGAGPVPAPSRSGRGGLRC